MIEQVIDRCVTEDFSVNNNTDHGNEIQDKDDEMYRSTFLGDPDIRDALLDRTG